MSLIEDALAIPRLRPGPSCSFSRLDPAQRAALMEALATPDVTDQQVRTALRLPRNGGLDVSVETLKRHRRGECLSCRY
jgi:hypothetical protein